MLVRAGLRKHHHRRAVLNSPPALALVSICSYTAQARKRRFCTARRGHRPSCLRVPVTSIQKGRGRREVTRVGKKKGQLNVPFPPVAQARCSYGVTSKLNSLRKRKPSCGTLGGQKPHLPRRSSRAKAGKKRTTRFTPPIRQLVYRIGKGANTHLVFS